MSTPMIQAQDVHKTYRLRGEDVHALRGISLTVPTGSLAVMIGQSGSGKTTFINLVSGLDSADSGSICVDGQCLEQLSASERRSLRRDRMGVVFQNFGLLPLLTAAENVVLPLRIRKLSLDEQTTRIAEALAWVEMSAYAAHRPYELSGGQQQRVALARALAAHPRLILADEPTGQLDSQTGAHIIGLLRRLVDERGITAFVVTHDPKVMHAADQVFEMRDGHLLR